MNAQVHDLMQGVPKGAAYESYLYKSSCTIYLKWYLDFVSVLKDVVSPFMITDKGKFVQIS